jgi:hypothetical protein
MNYLPNRFVALVLLFALCSGCGKHHYSSPIQRGSVQSGTLVVSWTISPGSPNFSPGPPQIGDNTLVLHVSDGKPLADVGDADVTGQVTNSLTGALQPETGRSQGGGVYDVPVHLPLQDKYTVKVTLERKAKEDVSVSIPITVQ